MSSELISALTDLATERGIDQLAVLERLEQDLARSYKGILDLDWDAQVTIDRESGRIFVYEMVGIGEEDPETGEYEDYEPRHAGQRVAHRRPERQARHQRDRP